MSLDTLSNVKARLGITGSADDSLIGLLQDSADKFIANWCERDFEGGSFTEYHPGGGPYLFLRNFPIASITSIKVDASYGFGSETLVASSAYVVHTERGVVELLEGIWLPEQPRVVQVVCTLVTGQVPSDVKEAYARLIGSWYRRVKTESASNFQNVMQQKFGDAFAIYDREGDVEVPVEVRNLLEPYRDIRI